MYNFRMKFFGGSLLVFLFCGCVKDDWFDAKYDKKAAVPTTTGELQAILDNGEVFNMYGPFSIENAGDDHYLEEEQAQQLVGFEKNCYIWTKERVNVNVPDWIGLTRGSYKKVFAANLVLESLKKIKPKNEVENAQSQNIKGQALFFRSQSFYWLAQVFVPPYTKETSDKLLGIPLRLTADVNEISVRSTVRATYSQILDDLKQSVELLPLKQNYLTRPSRIAAYAMLAKVYITIGDYINAHAMADLALAGYNVLINYGELNYTSTSNPFSGYNPEIILYSTMGEGTVFDFFNIRVNKELYNMYLPGDLRKFAFFNYEASGTITYKGTYSGSGFYTLFNGLATDELYLIRAECNARKGNAALALHDLNKLLRTRHDNTFNDLVASNAEEALKLVIEERRKELVFRGTRWVDLRRLNTDPRFSKTITRTMGGKTYTLEPNSYKYTLPIPDDIIQITGMQQNPGW